MTFAFQPFEAKVESLAHGGDAVLHHQGLAVFVASAVPGDVIRVEAMQLKPRQRFARATRFELLQPSPQRREPSCPYRPACGGCPWHEVGPATQAAAKATTVTESLKRIAGVDVNGLPPLLPDRCAVPGVGPGIAVSASDKAYRVRARFSILRQGGRSHAGFRGHASKKIIEIGHCEILVPQLAAPCARTLEMARQRSWPEAKLLCAAGYDPSRACASLVLETEPRHPEALLEQLLQAGFDGAEVVVAGDRAGGERVFSAGDNELHGVVAPGVDGAPFSHSARVFCQPQVGGNVDLVHAVLAATARSENNKIVELHAGSGNLTLPLAAAGARVWAVESDRAAVSLLCRNVESAGLRHRVQGFEGDAARLDSLLTSVMPPIDVLVLDPPRSGFKDLARVAQRFEPRSIVYVSCDPATLARDIQALLAMGYGPQGIQILDLMPGSWHVETVLLLSR